MSDPFSPGLLRRLPELPRKVVVVRASRIGDFICATPAFRALRAALPEAEITLVALQFNRELVERSPHLDRFVPFPGFPGMAEQFFDARQTAAFFARMQAQHFDLALQMHGSGVYSNPFTLMLGASITAGFVREGDPPGRLDAALPLPQVGHEVRRCLSLPEFLGAPAQGEGVGYPLWPEDRGVAEALLAAARPPLFGLHPATWDLTKRWAPERFAAVGARLRARYGGTVVVLGGPREVSLCDRVAKQVGEPCLNLGGRTALGVLGAVVERLAVLVTNDSGPAHVAYALGVPVVTVFGGTDPGRWGPPRLAPARALAHPVPCRPCDYSVCPVGYLCLEGLTVEKAAQAAESVMREQTQMMLTEGDDLG